MCSTCSVRSDMSRLAAMASLGRGLPPPSRMRAFRRTPVPRPRRASPCCRAWCIASRALLGGGIARLVEGVRLAIGVGKALAALGKLQIDVRIRCFVLVRPARAHFQENRISIGAVLQVMTVGDAGLESRAVACAERFFP